MQHTWLTGPNRGEIQRGWEVMELRAKAVERRCMHCGDRKARHPNSGCPMFQGQLLDGCPRRVQATTCNYAALRSDPTAHWLCELGLGPLVLEQVGLWAGGRKCMRRYGVLASSCSFARLGVHMPLSTISHVLSASISSPSHTAGRSSQPGHYPGAREGFHGQVGRRDGRGNQPSSKPHRMHETRLRRALAQ